MNAPFNVSFPGNEAFATILSCVVTILCEMAIFYFVLLCLKYWVPGKTNNYAVLGRFVGVLLSIVIAARIFTFTFTRYFPLDPDPVTIVLVVFILLSMGLTFSIYKQPGGGEHESAP